MIIDPVYEYKNLSNWIAPIVGKSIEPRLFAQRLSRYLNKHHSIRVKLITNVENLEIDDFSIGAEYDPELDQQHKKQIIINLFINHPKIVPWAISSEIAERFSIELTEALVHEYQHQHQYRSRRYKMHKEQFISEHRDISIKNEQEYLGNPDEIDAYAANIAARARLLNLNSGVLESISVRESLDLQNYIRTFGSDHVVVKTLLDKIDTAIQKLKLAPASRKKTSYKRKR